MSLTQKNSCAKYIFQGLQVGQINLSFFACLFENYSKLYAKNSSKIKRQISHCRFFSVVVAETVKSGMPIAMHWDPVGF